MLKQLAKRFARRPMSEVDLLEYCQGMIRNPPLPEDIRSALMSTAYSSGQLIIDKWREDFKELLAQIATEKTWTLQRQRLLMFRVSASSWLALKRAVGNEERVQLWRGYAEGAGDFALNPEDKWPGILQQAYFFGIMTNVILGLLGTVYYATDEKTDTLIEALSEMRRETIRAGMAVDRMVLTVVENDEALAEGILAWRNEIYLPTNQRVFALIREFGDRIASGSVDIDDISNRYKAACDACNAELKALGIDGS